MPADMARFRHIEEVFRSTCLGWGYGEIRTPVLEYLHLFTSAGTLSPDMLSRVYSFLDWDGWSGERVVLRPDGTIPVARFYAENMAGVPVARLYYVENMFSFEGTGQESRERWQCGAELIGGSEPEGDAELITLALEVLDGIGAGPVRVKLSHVGLFRRLLEELGFDEEERGERLKGLLSGDIAILKNLGGQPAGTRRFLKMLLGLRGKSSGFLGNLKSVIPPHLESVRPCIEDLSRVAGLLDSMDREYEIDFVSGEGFEYYTGMVFQFYSRGGVLGNGGRYDELITLVGGGKMPASGFALFLDRIGSDDMDVRDPAPVRILLAGSRFRAEDLKTAFEIAALLRSKGYIVEMDLGAGSGSGCHWIVNFSQKGRKIIYDLTDATTGEERQGLSRRQLMAALKEGGE